MTSQQIAPVLFLIFNRPDVTQQVFDEIRKAKPSQLFIAADGPRGGNENDVIRCAKTREVVTQIDWECEVKTLFREENLGCGKAVSGAITWFFDNVEAGIILEDDCLPNQSFFSFTSQMLDLHKDDCQVFHISGYTWVDSDNLDKPYYFMRYSNIWGWATWKRAWAHYNYRMSNISDDNLEGILSELSLTKEERYFQRMTFNETVRGNVDTWDYQWKFAIFKAKGYCVTPKYTLIENIGNVSGATRNINLRNALKVRNEPIKIDDSRLPLLDVEFENQHRIKYIWPKANYFYTLKSFKQKVKNVLMKVKRIFN
ncbi:nucleotide-diphospho-sugar transferase [Marinoscillum pacificum]|uniref:nucleotide-diphospho-sugar transferase n=1 Tax=Marinoscillum pacificum TaxID=392723 RepID=UPI0021573C06|nr:nucleotide-diphospho-sugar transferase [Marinoscillum pacificum]